VPESGVTDGHVNKFVLNDPSSPDILLEAHASIWSPVHDHAPPRISICLHA
jgi:hypothetical protein